MATKNKQKRYFVTIAAICENDAQHSYQIDGRDFDVKTDTSVEVTELQYNVIKDSGDKFTSTIIDA